MDDRSLYEIAKGLHQDHLDADRTLQRLLSRTGLALGVATGCLMTFKADGTVQQVYILGADANDNMQDRDNWTVLLKRGLIGYVYHSDRSVIIRNIGADPRWITVSSDMPQSGSAIGVPIHHHINVQAVMVFVHPQVEYFAKEELEFLTEVASLASDALANMRQVMAKAEDLIDTRYEAIFEHTPVPVILTDEEGIIVDANTNACEYLGFQRKVLHGIPLQDVNIITGKDIREIGEDDVYLPTNTYDIDGNSIPTLIRARRISLDGESYIEWILQDMSVQMELEQLRSDLTAMVYHDLRGPLGSINMAILKLGELLQGHDNPAVLKILQLGLRSSQQVSRLVEALLDIQRLEGGSSILNRQPSEVHVFLTDAYQLVMPMAEHAGITVEMDIEKLPEVDVDSDMLKRVVINLMENAVKYTPTGSNITLKTERRGPVVRIVVADTGPGIPEHMLDQIFNKYSRVKHQDAPKGVGLGLAFCRLAVEAHGGRIWVESDGKNGSEFIFTLPLESMDDTKPLSNPDLIDDDTDADSTEFATTA